MNVLPDTHVLLRAAFEPSRLSAAAVETLEHPDNALHFSPVSLWEIVIKNALGRPDFAVDAALLRRGLLENGYEELPVDGRHALAVGRLPPLHRDPFDRLLLAQATVEGFALLTSDEALAGYGAPVHAV